MIHPKQAQIIKELSALAVTHRKKIILTTSTGIVEGTPYRESIDSLDEPVVQFEDVQANAFNRNAETCEEDGILFLEHVKLTMGDTVKYCEGMLILYDHITGISVGDFQDEPTGV